MKPSFLLLICSMVCFKNVKSQTTNDILSLLIANKTITHLQADSIRVKVAIMQQETEVKQNLQAIVGHDIFDRNIFIDKDVYTNYNIIETYAVQLGQGFNLPKEGMIVSNKLGVIQY